MTASLCLRRIDPGIGHMRCMSEEFDANIFFMIGRTQNGIARALRYRKKIKGDINTRFVQLPSAMVG